VLPRFGCRRGTQSVRRGCDRQARMRSFAESSASSSQPSAPPRLTLDSEAVPILLPRRKRRSGRRCRSDPPDPSKGGMRCQPPEPTPAQERSGRRRPPAACASWPRSCWPAACCSSWRCATRRSRSRRDPRRRGRPGRRPGPRGTGRRIPGGACPDPGARPGAPGLGAPAGRGGPAAAGGGEPARRAGGGRRLGDGSGRRRHGGGHRRCGPGPVRSGDLRAAGAHRPACRPAGPVRWGTAGHRRHRPLRGQRPPHPGTRRDGAGDGERRPRRGRVGDADSIAVTDAGDASGVLAAEVGGLGLGGGGGQG
jgi:hypothetical protein